MCTTPASPARRPARGRGNRGRRGRRRQPPPVPRCRCWSRRQNFKLGRAKSHLSFSGGYEGGSLLFIGIACCCY
uniref:Uncharacterized protein n=1 Tax=Triticum urartu TaxID=4572 RepID=A0A8R7QC82_TRIUA